MAIENPDRSGNDNVVFLDPVADAALNWFATLQGYPHDPWLRAEFEAWRAADAAHARAFAEIAGVWELPELDIVAADVATSLRSPRENRPAIRRPAARSRSRAWTQAAMAAAALVLLTVGIQYYPVLMLDWRADYRTATGARAEIALPDGSRMTLNTDSAVALDFAGDRRAVTLLRGEAYFDVVRDTSRPFTVAAAFSEVEVKGTAFAVRREDNRDTVVIERGLVDVARLDDPGDRAELHPGEAVTATSMALSAVSSTDPMLALSWREGRLVFENQTFEQVLREIGRYYAHTIVVASDRVGQARVTGNYRLDNPERTIRSLAATVGGDVTRIPGGILIVR